MNNLTRSTNVLIYIFFLGIFFLSRTFMGLTFFGFRLGEIAIFISCLSFLLSLFFYKRFLQNFVSVSQTMIYLSSFLLFSFIIYVLYSKGNFLNLYIYKASSYIWVIGFLFIGIFVSQYNYINQRHTYAFLFLLLFIYYYSIYGIPDNWQDILLRYSDKFEYHKGSDILIMFVSTFYILNRLSLNKRLTLEIFLCYCFLFLPLLLFKSRGAFISLLVFIILELWFLRKSFKVGVARNLILFVLLMIILFQSIFIVNKSGFLKLLEVEENTEFIISYRDVPLEESGGFLYIKEGRVYSGDGNLNWRLQIWQDVVLDLASDQKLLTGFNYNEKIPAMDDPFRSGDDGTNENVHNFIINIIARGGIVHLATYLSLLYVIFKKSININDSSAINFAIPLLLASLLDSSMENSHFPLIFYFISGIIINKKLN
jgi:hypothetical protein